MPRKVAEWVGRTDDTAAPPRVRVRNFDAHNGICHLCSNKIWPGESWETDHVVRLKDGGGNVESNLAPAHKKCHSEKSGREQTAGAKVDRVRKKHLGVKAKKGRPMAGTKASGWKRKMDGTWERRS